MHGCNNNVTTLYNHESEKYVQECRVYYLHQRIYLPIASVPEVYFLRDAEHYRRVCGIAQAGNNAEIAEDRI